MRERYWELSFYRNNCLISIEGFKLEKLISRAQTDGIVFRNTHLISDMEIRTRISAADLKRLRKMTGAMYRITVLENFGAEACIRKALKRPVTIAGVLLAVIIVFIESLFAASIRIDGYKAIPEDMLRKCLNDAGIYEGAFIPKIKWSSAETALKETFPQLSWVQLVYDGRVILLNVSESHHKIISGEPDRDSSIFVPAAESQKEKKYSSIFAQKSGYVTQISPLYGKAMVEPGDYVRKGQVLISGVVPIEPTTFEEDAPTEYYVRSMGEVKAKVPYRIVFRQERFIRKAGADDDQVILSKKEKTESQVNAVVNSQIRSWVKENLPENAEIINKSLNFSYKKNIIEVGVTLEVVQEIGTEKEIVVGQKNSDN